MNNVHHDSSATRLDTGQPHVSVIMPVRNEAKFIGRSLGAVLAQDYPVDRIEVIVADGLSGDGTKQMLESFSIHHANVQVIDNPLKIVSTGLNAALRMARGEIIIRIDGHTIIDPDYVRECIATIQRTGADNVGGKMSAVGQTGFGSCVGLATNSPFGVGGARFHYSNLEEFVDTVYMGAWPRHVFKRSGLFDEEQVRNQDDEFNYRLLDRGGKILLNPKIKSTYAVRSNPRALWNQYFQYGYWKVRVLQKHPRQMRLRQFVPPVFVAGLGGSMFLTFFFPSFRILLAVVGGSYILADLVASLWTASRHGWRQFFLLPLVYAILHVSYGLGFLVGLVRFANRWGDKVGKVPTLDTDDI